MAYPTTRRILLLLGHVKIVNTTVIYSRCDWKYEYGGGRHRHLDAAIDIEAATRFWAGILCKARVYEQLSDINRLRIESLIKTAGLNLNRGEIKTLSCLRLSFEPCELRQHEIAERILITSGGITNICKQLMKRGWLARDKDQDDARSSVYRLTEPGIKIADSVILIVHNAEKELASCLKDQEIKELCTYLERITATIESH